MMYGRPSQINIRHAFARYKILLMFLCFTFYGCYLNQIMLYICNYNLNNTCQDEMLGAKVIS